MGLCFAMFVFLTFRGPLASHDSNRIRIAAASHDTMPLRTEGGVGCDFRKRCFLMIHGPGNNAETRVSPGAKETNQTCFVKVIS